MQLLNKRRVGSHQRTKDMPQVFTNLGQDDDFEECNGLSLSFTEWNGTQVDTEFKFFASTIANFERLAQGDRVNTRRVIPIAACHFTLTHLYSPLMRRLGAELYSTEVHQRVPLLRSSTSIAFESQSLEKFGFHEEQGLSA